ncbi:MAG TPA: DUF3810 domain-containing protein [Bacteroidales bacterium]|nr:DUF3810 domain-containing protein [Bacteroidales bacterium]
MPVTRAPKGRVIINIIPLIISIITFCFVRYSLSHPEAVEKYYSSGIYPEIAGVISFFSAMVPVSLWDIFWIGLSLFLITGIILVMLKRLSPGLYILRFAQMAAIFYSLFYLTWGFNYFRPPMEKRLGWITPKLSDKEFRVVLDSLIAGTNRNYIATDYSDFPEIEQSIEDSYHTLSHQLGLSWPGGTRTPKKILISSLFAKSGISGYFGPLFNEVHINHYQLPEDYAFTLAHEKAHQFGFANEAEANMAAFIACTGSSDKRTRYSGYMQIMLYFLEDAQQLSDYHSFIRKIDDDVIHDLRFRKSYYDNLRNRTIEKFQDSANNAYLKTQHIERGIKNYNQVVSLIMSWYMFSGQIMPVTPDPLAVK